MKKSSAAEQPKQKVKKNPAFDFETWKVEELERIKKSHVEENQITIAKIDKEWKTTLSQANKAWNSREDKLLQELINAEKAADELNTERKKNRLLISEIAQLEKELEVLRKPREDTIREERIRRISSLRYEINQLEAELRTKQEDLQNITKEKEKYKKLSQQALGTLKQKREKTS